MASDSIFGRDAFQRGEVLRPRVRASELVVQNSPGSVNMRFPAPPFRSPPRTKGGNINVFIGVYRSLEDRSEPLRHAIGPNSGPNDFNPVRFSLPDRRGIGLKSRRQPCRFLNVQVVAEVGNTVGVRLAKNLTLPRQELRIACTKQSSIVR
jgi:hypothetical protein